MNEKQVRALLQQLCVELGFCLPPLEIEKLASDPPSGVLDFTNAVLVAEGMEMPSTNLRLCRQVRDKDSSAFASVE